jgi:hypothetical protein
MNPATRCSLLGGGVLSAASLLLALASTRAALGGWLVGFAFWSAAPIGALVLLAMMHLIPGAWREQLRPSAERLLLLLPLAAAAVLPLLLDLGAIYGWAGAVQTGFRAIYLAPWTFVLRSILLFCGAAVFALLLLRRPAWGVPVAAGGLITFVLLDTLVIVDWLCSLDPHFHASGFGLYGLSIQVLIALGLLVLLRLAAGDAAPHNGVLAALLLSGLLIWGYLAFMQYLISWSNNLAEPVAWYARRSEGRWIAVEYLYVLLQAVPAALLLSAPVRRSRQWLIRLSLSVLLGKVLEIVWLVLPEIGTGNLALLSAAASLAGLGLLSIATLLVGRDALFRLRTHGASRSEAAP